MLNTTNYQGKANQNYNKISPHMYQDDHNKIKENNNCYWEKGEAGI